MALAPEAHGVIERLGASVVRIDADADITGAYAAWFADLGADWALLRPDFYLFAAASGPEALAAAITDLQGQLRLLPAGG